MERLPMCRVCLVQNVRMYIVVGKNMQDLYELLTDIPFVTEDTRPALACYFCYVKLKQCCQLQQQCLEAEELFAKMMNEPHPSINRTKLKLYNGFVKTPVQNISIDSFGQMEQVAVKEESPEVCEQVEDFIERKGEPHSDENGHLDVEDASLQHCESDVEIVEFMTKVEDKRVLRKKRTAADTRRASAAKKAKEDTHGVKEKAVIPEKKRNNEKSDTKSIQITQNNVTEEEEKENVIEGTLPKLPHKIFARAVQSAGTSPRAAPDSVMIPVISTAESNLPPEEETISSGRTSPRTKKRPIQFSPSTGIVQSSEPPPSPVKVMANIELLGLTTSSTTSKTAPSSGRSAYEIDLNRDFLEPGEGSDVEPEPEENLDISLRPSNVQEYPDSEVFEDPSLADAMVQIDSAADSALRTVVGPEQDLLHFDWQSDPENFEGVREIFTVPSTGPTFPNAELTPLEVFLKIWDTDIIAHIVRETNRYGRDLLERNRKPQSRISRWKDVTDDDLLKYFAIIMLQSLVVDNVEREYWYPKFEELRIGDFRAIMPYNRFLVIKRCLHFVDNTFLPEHPNRLDKIMPVIEHLNNKFSTLYVLEQNVTIDESLLLWKGRLSFAQKVATKKARAGIESYELCESRTGYLWRMEVNSGKGHVHVAQVRAQEPVKEHEERDEPESATSQIVLTLMRPLFDRGHTVVMDNFYNAPLLSRVLKLKHKTDSMGTLRLCREFVPEGLKVKNKENMRSGEVAFSTTKDLNVVVWMDKSIVSMISTFHQVQVGGKDKYGYYKYKPQVILDYNRSMGGLDHKDQMLHAYPIERVRNTIWYKKLFRRLVNVSIHNAFVMFNHNRTQSLGNRDFRFQLAQGLLQMCRPRPVLPAVPAAPSQMHMPAKNERKQRCKLCYAAKVCRSTMWRCSTCAVNLCIQGCYTAYHENM